MVAKSLKKFLKEKKVKFETKKHKQVFTAQEIAGASHTPGAEFAKVIVAKAKEGPFIAVLPASYRIDLKKLKSAVGSAGPVKIATEKDFKDIFPDCEVGAMPPFGSLYKLPVVADKSLTMDEMITFNAGNHKETMRMRFKDFHALEHPRISSFAYHA
jgi:Ala-tRNA(Pro) deacylase